MKPEILINVVRTGNEIAYWEAILLYDTSYESTVQNFTYTGDLVTLLQQLTSARVKLLESDYHVELNWEV